MLNSEEQGRRAAQYLRRVADYVDPDVRGREPIDPPMTPEELAEFLRRLGDPPAMS